MTKWPHGEVASLAEFFVLGRPKLPNGHVIEPYAFSTAWQAAVEADRLRRSRGAAVPVNVMGVESGESNAVRAQLLRDVTSEFAQTPLGQYAIAVFGALSWEQNAQAVFVNPQLAWIDSLLESAALRRAREVTYDYTRYFADYMEFRESLARIEPADLPSDSTELDAFLKSLDAEDLVFSEDEFVGAGAMLDLAYGVLVPPPPERLARHVALLETRRDGLAHLRQHGLHTLGVMREALANLPMDLGDLANETYEMAEKVRQAEADIVAIADGNPVSATPERWVRRLQTIRRHLRRPMPRAALRQVFEHTASARTWGNDESFEDINLQASAFATMAPYILDSEHRLLKRVEGLLEQMDVLAKPHEG